MGNKASKHAGQWPPYGYPGSQYGQPAPFFPPGFQPPPGQAPTGMGGPVIPHMYPGMPGSQVPFIPPPEEKGFFGRKKKRSQSEQYPGGYMPFPQREYGFRYEQHELIRYRRQHNPHLLQILHL